MKRVLVTGAAGFIGYHLVLDLLAESELIVHGLDNLNDYYDVSLKLDRLSDLGVKKPETENELYISTKYQNFTFVKADLSNHEFVLNYFTKHCFDVVINLAAQAGVRYSIENPRSYTKSNIDGFLSVLEGCKLSRVKHLIYASTSSVYGLNSTMPLSEEMSVNHPISVYSATKKANELLAHTYSHLFDLPTTGLRFFTVYGPWGRPDMALFLFTKAILDNQSINVFNNGNMIRDFTYVKDVVVSIRKLMYLPPKRNPKWSTKNVEAFSSSAPYQIFNIGNNNPTKLIDYIKILEKVIGKKAKLVLHEMQPGDVAETNADSSRLETAISFKPSTPIEEGVKNFVEWYKEYFNKL